MYIISSFVYSANLELAISEIEQKGIARERIFAAPLDKRVEKRKILDTINQSDGKSLSDLIAVLGTIFMLFGAIYGFILEWGPILWALIGLVGGAVLGFLIDLMFQKNHGNGKKTGNNKTEVILIVNCEQKQAEMVENALWDNMALGVTSWNKTCKRKIVDDG